MLRASDYPLPAPFETAFAAADTLVFETDIAGMNAPETALTMQAHLMYGGVRTLRDDLSVKTYMTLKKYVVANALPMQMFDKMKPVMVALTVMQLELQHLGMSAPGVDQHYFIRAKGAGKRVLWFESIGEQVSILAELGRKDPDGMIKESLEEIGEYEHILTKLLEAWKDGDAQTLQKLGREYLVGENPNDYRRLITDRNHRWTKKLGEMLRSRETEFVLVGALHLVGPDGLVAQLRRKGYRVEQL